MFSIQAKLIAAIMLAVFIAGVYWRGHTQGWKARDVIAQADAAAQLEKALQAESAARVKEQELQAKVGKVDRAYQDQKRATATVAAAAGVGLRNLEAALSRPSAAASNAGATSGIDGDPRDGILAECASALVRLDSEARRLADQTIALQNYASGVCVK